MGKLRPREGLELTGESAGSGPEAGLQAARQGMAQVTFPVTGTPLTYRREESSSWTKGAKLWPQPVSHIKFHWHTATPTCLRTVCSFSYTTMAELSCDRDVWPEKPTLFTPWPFAQSLLTSELEHKATPGGGTA